MKATAEAADIGLAPGRDPSLPLGPYRRARDGGIERFSSAGGRVIRFIERHCVLTKSAWIGQPFRLLPWQRQLLWDLFELSPCAMCGRECRRYTEALILMAKKQGKTELVAALALYFLIADEEPAPFIPCAAAGDDQADLVFNAAKFIGENSPTLSGLVECWERSIFVPEKPGAELRRVPASGGRLDGPPIYVAIKDEYHEWITDNNRKTDTVLTMGTAGRRHPLEIMISTAGSLDRPSRLLEKYKYGKRVESGEIEDPQFFFRSWEAPEGCDWRDLEMLRYSCPSLGVLVQTPFYEDKLRRVPEADYRRYYLNQWVASEEMWLPFGAWDALAMEDMDLEPGAVTGVAWDQSTRRDSTAVVWGQWVGDGEGRELRVKARIWERPLDSEGRPVEDWKVPIGEVLGQIRELGRQYDVVEVGYDPWGLTLLADELEAEGLPMVAFPQTDARMVPATEAAYELIMGGRLRHDGDVTLARHIRGARPRESMRGGKRLTKARDGVYSDGAVALVMLVGVMLAQGGDEEPQPFVIVVEEGEL